MKSMNLKLLPALALAILTASAFAQTQLPPPKVAENAVEKAATPNPLALTDAERKALEPLQQAAIEANQELIAAADALDAAKSADVLAAAWRWKAALTAFKATLTARGTWIAGVAKAHDCAGCELNLQTMELQRAKQQ